MVHPLEALVKFCAEPLVLVRTELPSRSHHSMFEIDYEANMALFFVANFTSGSQAVRRGSFSTALKERLQWSRVYRDLLSDRLVRQPSFDLADFRAASQDLQLGLAVYRVALAASFAATEVRDDELAFLKRLRTTLLPSTREEEVRHVETEFSRVGDLGPDCAAQLKQLEGPMSVRSESEVRSLEDCLADLDGLIGLEPVKEEVKKLVSFLQVQKKREAVDLPTAGLTNHMVFTGSPGTGKTTVARLLAQILRALGLLTKGHLIETDRNGLVGQYVGHTEVKTAQVVDEALDGILFIDEAYGLSRGGESDFGQRAIDTLVKRMEDHRERLVVIVAGYSTEMTEFIESNPGLRSRFSTYIQFANYNEDELEQIFQQLAESGGYRLDEAARSALKRLFGERLAAAGRSFGNGRYVRNTFEAILRNQALRLAHAEQEPTREDLMTLLSADIVVAPDPSDTVLDAPE